MQSSPAREGLNFSSANPHALATILQASETRSIIASRDIFDITGTKLWAREQPVSQALQRKLLDRQLRHPLESCLYAEDGVTGRSLVFALESLIAADSTISLLLKRYADKLVHAANHLPLHSVVQLLLTAGQAARPESFDHAVQAMALNGALSIARGGDTGHLRLAMLAGLVHDLGEMYIAPEFGEADAHRTLDFQSYQQLVVHPHVGRLLIEQLTNYPPEVARAVAEHHERLDGSGFPHCLQREQISPLGRLLAVTDGTLAVLRSGGQLGRASVALRAVPGEFDLSWVGLVAYTAQKQSPMEAVESPEQIQQRLGGLDRAMQAAQERVDTALAATACQGLKDALGLARHLLVRLRTGWNASGLWSAASLGADDAPELEAVEQELEFRLRSIERAARLRAGDLPPEDAERLNAVCEGLRVG
ncbi:MAG TPA: HD domain-containing phosphohydrolase [Burkholderiaceae bacterium]|nr:HD domain-containing phosphohydrolase [Burkholderiaceae bacterium]